MRRSCLFALVLGALTAGIASPQSIQPDLMQYLNLTETQVQSINTLNSAFNQYTNTQDQQSYDLQSQVTTELAKAAPDPGVVGNLYAQIEMISRANKTQLAQLQSNIAAALTPAQIALVGNLLNVARLQPLLSEAQTVDMEPAVPTSIERVGDFSIQAIYDPASSVLCCYTTPIPVALVNYLNLSDAQNIAILNAIQANQDYLEGQSLKIQALQYAIQALTAAPTIDTATLGADYVTIGQIQRDEATQAGQLMTTVRDVLTDQQQPQLKALDNALSLGSVEYEAVQYNILVLPPDLIQSNGLASFLLGIPGLYN